MAIDELVRDYEGQDSQRSSDERSSLPHPDSFYAITISYTFPDGTTIHYEDSGTNMDFLERYGFMLCPPATYERSVGEYDGLDTYRGNNKQNKLESVIHQQIVDAFRHVIQHARPDSPTMSPLSGEKSQKELTPEEQIKIGLATGIDPLTGAKVEIVPPQSLPYGKDWRARGIYHRNDHAFYIASDQKGYAFLETYFHEQGHALHSFYKDLSEERAEQHAAMQLGEMGNGTNPYLN